MTSTDRTNAGRLLDLLDKAYQAPDSPERFDDLLEAAKSYFFGTDGAEIAPHVPHAIDFDARLAPHIERIQRLLDESGAAARQDAQAPFARLVIAPGGRILSGNSAAAAFLSAQFPCALEALDLGRESCRKILGALATLSPGETSALHLMTETGSKPAIAICRRVAPEDGGGLELALSHVEWTQERIAFVASALDLTGSESGILAGILSGASQSEIAAARGRSIETVKAQSKSILRKTGCAKMSDVAQLCASIAFLLAASGRGAARTPASAPAPMANILPLGNGRELGYYRYGAARGRPILHFHALLQGPFFIRSFTDCLSDIGATLYAPSRPGFGATTPAPEALYEASAIEDLIALCGHERLDSVLFLVHQGGVSHAYRAAARLGERVKGMVMVGGGIPIDEKKHLAHMDRYTRVAAAASRYAPSVMELITRIAVANYRKRGERRFLEDFYAGSSADLRSLREPEIAGVLERGLAHLIAQGPKAFVADGRSAMADWRADFERATCRTHWLHGEEDQVMGADFVREWVTGRSNHPVEIVRGAGYNILHTHPHLVLDAIREALCW